MTTWRNVSANSNLIQTKTGKAVLIKLPGSSWLFWHPAKLVRTSGKNDYYMSISFTDDFVFKLFKNGKGKYNKFEKIDEWEMSADEFAKYFE